MQTYELKHTHTHTHTYTHAYTQCKLRHHTNDAKFNMQVAQTEVSLGFLAELATASVTLHITLS